MMFESDCSDDEYNLSYKSVTDFTRKEEIPLKLWAEHFSKPEKDRSRSLTKIFNKEYNFLRSLYCFLQNDQVFGKTLTKFGIPHLCGKINKTFLKISTKHKVNKYERRNKIYLSKPRVLSQKTHSKPTKSKREDFIAPRYQRLTVEKFSNSVPRQFESIHKYPAKNHSLYEGVLKSSEHKNVQSEISPSVELISKLANKTPIGSFQNNVEGNMIRSTKITTVNKQKGSLKSNDNKSVLLNKKYVRFNDNDLCSFAPTQESLPSRKSSNDEAIFDEIKKGKLASLPDNAKTCYVLEETEINFTSDTVTNTLNNLLTSSAVSCSNDKERLGQSQVNLEQSIPNKSSDTGGFEIEPYDCENIIIQDFTESNSENKYEMGLLKNLPLNKNITQERNSNDSTTSAVTNSKINQVKTPTDSSTELRLSNDTIQTSQPHIINDEPKRNHLKVLETNAIMVPETPSSDEKAYSECLSINTLVQDNSKSTLPNISKASQILHPTGRLCDSNVVISETPSTNESLLPTGRLCDSNVVIPETPSTDESVLGNKILSNNKTCNVLENNQASVIQKELHSLQTSKQTHLQSTDSSDDEFIPLSPLQTHNESSANISAVNGNIIYSEEVGNNLKSIVNCDSFDILPSMSMQVQNITGNIELSPCTSLSGRDYISDNNESEGEELLIEEKHEPRSIFTPYAESLTGKLCCEKQEQALFEANNAPAKLKPNTCNESSPVVKSQANTIQTSESKVRKVLFPVQPKTTVSESDIYRNVKCSQLLTTDSIRVVENHVKQNHGKMLTTDDLNAKEKNITSDEPHSLVIPSKSSSVENSQNDLVDPYNFTEKPHEPNDRIHNEHGDLHPIPCKEANSRDSDSVCSSLQKVNDINLSDTGETLPTTKGSRSPPNNVTENLEKNNGPNRRTYSQDSDFIICSQTINEPSFVQTEQKTIHASSVLLLTSMPVPGTLSKKEHVNENNYGISPEEFDACEDSQSISSIQPENDDTFSVCSPVENERNISLCSPNAINFTLSPKTNLENPQRNFPTVESLIYNVSELKGVQSEGDDSLSIPCQQTVSSDNFPASSIITNHNTNSANEDSLTLYSKSCLMSPPNDFSISENIIERGGEIHKRISSENCSLKNSVPCTPSTSLPSTNEMARLLLQLSEGKYSTNSNQEGDINQSYKPTCSLDTLRVITSQQTDEGNSIKSPNIDKQFSESPKLQNEDNQIKKGTIYLNVKTPTKLTVYESSNLAKCDSMEQLPQIIDNKSKFTDQTRNVKCNTQLNLTTESLALTDNYKVQTSKSEDNLQPSMIEDAIRSTTNIGNKELRVEELNGVHKIKRFNTKTSIIVNNKKEQTERSDENFENIDQVGVHTKTPLSTKHSETKCNITNPTSTTKNSITTLTSSTIVPQLQAQGEMISQTSKSTYNQFKKYKREIKHNKQLFKAKTLSSKSIQVNSQATNHVAKDDCATAISSQQVMDSFKSIKNSTANNMPWEHAAESLLDFKMSNYGIKQLKSDDMGALGSPGNVSHPASNRSHTLMKQSDRNKKIVASKSRLHINPSMYDVSKKNTPVMYSSSNISLAKEEMVGDQSQIVMNQPTPASQNKDNSISRQRNLQIKSSFKENTKLYSSSKISLSKDHSSNSQSNQPGTSMNQPDRKNNVSITERRHNESALSDMFKRNTNLYSSSALFLSKEVSSNDNSKPSGSHINQERSEMETLEIDKYSHRGLMFTTSSIPVLAPPINGPSSCGSNVHTVSKIEELKTTLKAYQTENMLVDNSSGTGAKRSILSWSTIDRLPLNDLPIIKNTISNGISKLSEKDINKKSSSKSLSTKNRFLNRVPDNHVQQRRIDNSNVSKGQNDKGKIFENHVGYKSFPTITILNAKLGKTKVDNVVIDRRELDNEHHSFETSSGPQIKPTDGSQLRNEKSGESELESLYGSIHAKGNVISYTTTSTIKPVIFAQRNTKEAEHKYKFLIEDSPPESNDESLHLKDVQGLDKKLSVNERNGFANIISSDEESPPNFRGSMDCTSGNFSPLSSIGSNSLKSSKRLKRRLLDSLDYYTSDDSDCKASLTKFPRYILPTSPSSDTNKVSLDDDVVSSVGFGESYISDTSEEHFDGKDSDCNKESRFFNVNNSPQYNFNLSDLSSPDNIVSSDHPSTMMMGSPVPALSDGLYHDLISSPAPSPAKLDGYTDNSPLYDHEFLSSGERSDNYLIDMFDD